MGGGGGAGGRQRRDEDMWSQFSSDSVYTQAVFVRDESVNCQRHDGAGC